MISHLKLTVYNVPSQRVRELVNQGQVDGSHQVLWDGREDTGVRVASGIYRYNLEAGDFQQTRKILLVE